MPNYTTVGCAWVAFQPIFYAIIGTCMTQKRSKYNRINAKRTISQAGRRGFDTRLQPQPSRTNQITYENQYVSREAVFLLGAAEARILGL
jgi:hypothetical protein